jgi:signal transduction histidine kinase
MTAALWLLGWLAAAGLAGWAVWLSVVVARLRARLELVARAEHELRGPLTAFGLALHAARGTPAGRRLALVLDSELARVRAALVDLEAARAGRRAPEARSPGARSPRGRLPGARAAVRADALLHSSGSAWDLAARARGRRVRVRSDGPALVRGDRDRLASALGNVMANAVEHGQGDVDVAATRASGRLRIEVTNPAGPPGGERGRERDGDGEGDGDGDGDVDRGRGRARGRGLDIAADAVADCGGNLSSAIGPRRARAVIDLPLEQ